MSSVNFGVGYIFGRRTDISNPTTAYLGIAQSFDLSHTQAIKELMGQFKVAVDAAGGALKITGKVSFAQMQSAALNNLFFGQTLTSASGRQISVVTGGLPESHAAATSVTVTNSGVFAEDLGVAYAATGLPLTRVASGPAVGQYSVNETTGIYTFNASETGTLLFFYEYTVTNMSEISVVNQLMGFLPTFELHLQQYYVNNLGTLSTLHVKLNACRGSKLDWKFKNDDYLMQDYEFQAFADAAGNIGTWDFNV